MKKLLLSFSVLIFLTGSSFSEENNVEKEKKAIVQAIKGQTQASSNRDLNLATSFWVQDESVVRINSDKNSYSVLLGWDKIGSRYKEGMKNNPNPMNVKKEYSNFKIKVYKESAWAVFNETTYDSDGKINNVQLGTRFLEKEGSKWKIVYMAFLVTSSYEQ